MDKNTKLVFLIALGIFIGFGAYRLAEWYFVMYQVEKFTTEVQQEVEQVTARTQQQLEASSRESARRYIEQQALMERQKRERAQKALEANLMCAANVDTGKCSCYDKTTSLPVTMEPVVCLGLVKKQASSN